MAEFSGGGGASSRSACIHCHAVLADSRAFSCSSCYFHPKCQDSPQIPTSPSATADAQGIPAKTSATQESPQIPSEPAAQPSVLWVKSKNELEQGRKRKRCLTHHVASKKQHHEVQQEDKADIHNKDGKVILQPPPEHTHDDAGLEDSLSPDHHGEIPPYTVDPSIN